MATNCTVTLEPYLTDKWWEFMLYPWLVTFGLMITYYVALKWDITLVPITRIVRQDYRPLWSYFCGTIPKDHEAIAAKRPSAASKDPKSSLQDSTQRSGSNTAVVYFEYLLVIKLDVISVNFDFNSVSNTPHRDGPQLVLRIHNPEDPSQILDTIRVPLNYIFRRNVINAKTDQRVAEFLVYSSVLFDLIRIVSLHHTVPGRTSAFIRIFHVDLLTTHDAKDAHLTQKRHFKIHQEIGARGNPREMDVYKVSPLSAGGKVKRTMSTTFAAESGDTSLQERLLEMLYWFEIFVFLAIIFLLPILLIHFVIHHVPYCSFSQSLLNGFYSALVSGLAVWIIFIVYRWTIRAKYITSRQDNTIGLFLLACLIILLVAGVLLGVWGWLISTQIKSADQIGYYRIAYWLSYLVLLSGVGPTLWLASYALGLFLDLPYPMPPKNSGAETETSSSLRKRTGLAFGKSVISGTGNQDFKRAKSSLRLAESDLPPAAAKKSSKSSAQKSKEEGSLPSLEGASRKSSKSTPGAEPPGAARKDSTGSTYRESLKKQDEANSVSAYINPKN